MKSLPNLIPKLFITLLLLLTCTHCKYFVQEQIMEHQSSEHSHSRDLQLFSSSSSIDCASCYSKSTTSSYCLVSSTTEWCCSSNDTSSACTNNNINVTCSPQRATVGNLFYTYCRGASNYRTCAVDDLELTAHSYAQTVTVSSLPYSVMVSNTKSYLSCYYHIKADPYTWKSGAKINIKISNATDVSFYLYGGTSRTNASINFTASNASLTVNKSYSIDISTEAILLILPTTNKYSTSYVFTYSLSGEEYNWWQKLIMGPQGQTYFIIALVCAGVIGLVFLIAFILLIVFCCKRKNQKIGNAPHTPLDNNSIDQSNRAGHIQDLNDINVNMNNTNLHTLEGQRSIDKLGNPYDGKKTFDNPPPVIKKYDNNSQAQTKDDEYYQNPFLPQNIQKNKQNNLPPANNQQPNRGNTNIRKL